MLHKKRIYCKKDLCSKPIGPFDDLRTAIESIHALADQPYLITDTTDVLWFPLWAPEGRNEDSNWYYKTHSDAPVRGPYPSMILFKIIRDSQLPSTTLFKQGDVSLWRAASNADIRAIDAKVMAGRIADARDKEQVRLETRRRIASNRKQLVVSFIVIITILLGGKALYSIDQSIKHRYDGTTNELPSEEAVKKATDKRAEDVRTGQPILAKKNPVQLKKPAPVIATRIASDLRVHPRVVKREVAPPTTSQQLYDQAVTARRLYPEKSWELLGEIIKREERGTIAGVHLLSLTWGLIEDLGSDPYALYRNALYCRETNLEGARRCLVAALEHHPDEQLKQKVLSLQTELGVDVIQTVGSVASQTSALTEETLTHERSLNAPVIESRNEEQMRRIFKDWSKQRGAALKRAGKFSKARSEAYMRSVDQQLVRDLTEKYKITHEELDRIEAYGAEHNWW